MCEQKKLIDIIKLVNDAASEATGTTAALIATVVNRLTEVAIIENIVIIGDNFINKTLTDIELIANGVDKSVFDAALTASKTVNISLIDDALTALITNTASKTNISLIDAASITIDKSIIDAAIVIDTLEQTTDEIANSNNKVIKTLNSLNLISDAYINTAKDNLRIINSFVGIVEIAAKELEQAAIAAASEYARTLDQVVARHSISLLSNINLCSIAMKLKEAAIEIAGYSACVKANAQIILATTQAIIHAYTNVCLYANTNINTYKQANIHVYDYIKIYIHNKIGPGRLCVCEKTGMLINTVPEHIQVAYKCTSNAETYVVDALIATVANIAITVNITKTTGCFHATYKQACDILAKNAATPVNERISAVLNN